MLSCCCPANLAECMHTDIQTEFMSEVMVQTPNSHDTGNETRIVT